MNMTNPLSLKVILSILFIPSKKNIGAAGHEQETFIPNLLLRPAEDQQPV